MKAGVLKRSLVGLLVLTLVSMWQAAPAFAAHPCGMQIGTLSSESHSSAPCHCKMAAGECVKMTICCQVSPNLLGPDLSSVALVHWARIEYSDLQQTLAGLYLVPALHPPSARV